jgi:hypothetical protein
MFIGKTHNYQALLVKWILLNTKDDEFLHKKMAKPITYSLFAFSSESLSLLSNLGLEKIENKTFKPN